MEPSKAPSACQPAVNPYHGTVCNAESTFLSHCNGSIYQASRRNSKLCLNIHQTVKNRRLGTAQFSHGRGSRTPTGRVTVVVPNINDQVRGELEEEQTEDGLFPPGHCYSRASLVSAARRRSRIQ